MRAQPERQSGFSLIELLIVVAIILIIAAIAIPNLMRSRMSANEAAAVQSLRNITSALATYRTTFPQCGYPDSLNRLKPGTPTTDSAAGLLDSIMANDTFTKSGYTFSYVLTNGAGDCSGTPGEDYEVEAKPSSFQRTGVRGFFVNATLVIRADGDGDAEPNSSPL
ncbi:MAG TPA: prepilin-type N-terminal cleavage/methylation domain-containing protein [Candidatus Acidoferrales bacterium]|nr:prepilin-type N-terminal cleavage/methylation domain-containing protein [Candidatus Acidoferrales bacterium]